MFFARFVTIGSPFLLPKFFVYLLQEIDKRNPQGRAKIPQVNGVDLTVPTFPLLHVGMGLADFLADLTHG